MEDERKELTEVLIFDKEYKVADLSDQIKLTFNALQRMEQEAQEASYQSVKANSAVQFQATALKKMLDKDKDVSEPEIGEVSEV